MTARTDDTQDHPIDHVLDLLCRLRSCADLLDTLAKTADLPVGIRSQFYTVSDMIRRTCADADAQALLICDEVTERQKSAFRPA